MPLSAEQLERLKALSDGDRSELILALGATPSGSPKGDADVIASITDLGARLGAIEKTLAGDKPPKPAEGKSALDRVLDFLTP